MSLSLAQRSAWNLAKTLMVCVTLFKAGSEFGVMPSAEFDGAPTASFMNMTPGREPPQLGGSAEMRSRPADFWAILDAAPWWWRRDRFCLQRSTPP